ncbi:MAG TPA: neutral/alkaline non-lysosomal ceramidase N-terminal domain-containing protein [bacterium]|nr:neutral/alkaline non-lysosomal ceramidase N-terminal domain-containing protein [bacterium]
MKKVKVFCAGLIVLVALALSIPASAAFMAGAAAADITPDLSAMKVPSSGYGDRGPKPMEGVHDPIMCKALVVSDGANKAAIVTCDMVGISPDLRAKVLAAVQGTGIDDHNLLMAASHTHSGPGAMLNNGIAGVVFGKYNDKLTQQTADRIGAAVKQADASMRPAVLKVGTASAPDATRNRRDPAGSYNYDTRRFSSAYEPNNPRNSIDPAVTVVEAVGEDGKPIAVLVSFATHGTVLGPDNMQLSADWPGAMQKKIEAALPGAVALYMNGAEGDQAPAMDQDDHTDFEYLDIIGVKVADAALAALDNAATVAAAPVTAVMERRAMPPGKVVMGYHVPSALIKHYFPELPLQAVRVGDVVFMAAPLEMVTAIGQTLKSGARGQGARYPIVAGLANDTLLYCATPEDFPKGGYEVGNTIFGEIEAGVVIGEQMLLVRKLMASE